MDRRFWRLKSGLSRMNLATAYFIQLAKGDLRDAIIDSSRFIAQRLGLHALAKRFAYQSGVMVTQDEAEIAIAEYQQRIHQVTERLQDSRPVIFVSACMDSQNGGGWKFNGGIKELNCLVKLLRNRGYEAYVVTYDGQYEPWLIDHQPHLSLVEFREKVRSLPNIRCVTSWSEAEAFIQECSTLYFWDMEVGFVENEHFPLLAALYKHKIKNSAAISRTIQAWHMAHFRTSCTLLPNLVDDSLWMPNKMQRNVQRIGYMEEGKHTEPYLKIIQEISHSSGLELEFFCLKGSESQILADMQSCTVFLTLNLGKDRLWGEGGPLPPLEALSVGCIPITFDILGPREIIQNGFNGKIVPCYRPDLMAKALVDLYREPDEISRMRSNALALFQASYTFAARWEAVKTFLDISEAEHASVEHSVLREYAEIY